jgi:hypothetical protein
MDCSVAAELLPDYFQRSGGEDWREIEEHLQSCASCREEAELWTRLGSIPSAQPGPAVRARFEAMLETWRDTHANVFAIRFAQIAAVAALVAVAFLAGLSAGRRGGNDKELASLHRELADTRRLVALSLLQQQSASDRLAGVSWSTRAGGPNQQVLEALLTTLRYDDSVDVRLAALDALRRYGDQVIVRDGVGDSLAHQDSPMVQLAVVDSLVAFRDPGAVVKLKTFERAPDLLPVVRQRVARGITELSKG